MANRTTILKPYPTCLCAMLETFASENSGGVMLILEMKMGSAHQQHNAQAAMSWRMMATVHRICERRNAMCQAQDHGDGENVSTNPIILCLSGRSTSHGRSDSQDVNMHGSHSIEYDQICRAAHEAGALVALRPLSVADRRKYTCACFGVTDVPEPVFQTISRMAAGNPLHTELLAEEMMRSGLVRIEQGAIAEHAETFDTLQRNYMHVSLCCCLFSGLQMVQIQ